MESHKTFKLKKVLKCRTQILQDKSHLFSSNNFKVFTGSSLVYWLLNNYNPFDWKNHGQYVDWMIDGADPTPEERQKMTRHIYEELYDPALAHQVIYPVDHNSGFFDSEGHLYRFVTEQFDQWRQDPQVLNLYTVHPRANKLFCELEDGAQTINVDQIMQEMKGVFEKIYKDYTEQDGTIVDYEGLRNSQFWNLEYIAFVSKLAYMDLSGILKNDNLTKAFFINVYNMMAIHAIIAQYNDKKKLEINADTFNMYKYNIAGHNYTLNDIQHGILRKNSPGTKVTFDAGTSFFSFKAQGPRLNNADPRFKFMVKNSDPRVNLALCLCGSALRFYDEKNIEKELDSVAREYCNKEVEVIEDRNIQVGGLFKEYLSDFGGGNVELMDWILRYCEDRSVKKKIEQLKREETEKECVEFKKFSHEVNNAKK